VSSNAPESTEATEISDLFGYVSLASGRTHLLFPRKEEESRAGAIYTDAADMPSLEELLKQREIAFAVLERPAPSLQPQPSAQPEAPTVAAEAGRARRRISTRRIVAAAMIPAATGAVGWTLFADSISDTAVQANPYTALILALAGFVLLASLLVALRD
jgi:hypothetical protein